MPERSLLTLQAEFCAGGGSAPVSNGVASLGPAAQLPVPDISLAGGNGAPAVPSTNGLANAALTSSLPQVLYPNAMLVEDHTSSAHQADCAHAVHTS